MLSAVVSLDRLPGRLRQMKFVCGVSLNLGTDSFFYSGKMAREVDVVLADAEVKSN